MRQMAKHPKTGRSRSVTFLAASMCAAAGLFLTACTPAAGPAAAPGTDAESDAESGVVSEGPITLTFTNWAGSEEFTGKNIALVIEEFEAQNPNITIESIPVPFNQMRTTVLTRFSAGDSPDVMQLAQNVPFELASEGLLLDLEKAGLVDEEWIATHSGVDNGRVDGALIAAPWIISPFALWYDKELMEAAGLDPDSPPTTLEELISQSEEATEFLRARDAYAFGLDTTNDDVALFQYLNVMYMFGADPLKGSPNFDTPEIVASLQFLQDAVENEWTPVGQGIRQLRELQANGNIMFRLDGPFVAGIFRSLNPELEGEAFFERFGIAGIPKGPSGNNGAVFNGHQLTIAADTPHPEAAWKFVEFLIDSDISISGYQLPQGVIPALASATATPEYEAALSPGIARVYADDVVPFLQQGPYGPVYATATTIILRGMQKVALQGQDPAEVATETELQLRPLF